MSLFFYYSGLETHHLAAYPINQGEIRCLTIEFQLLSSAKHYIIVHYVSQYHFWYRITGTGVSIGWYWSFKQLTLQWYLCGTDKILRRQESGTPIDVFLLFIWWAATSDLSACRNSEKTMPGGLKNHARRRRKPWWWKYNFMGNEIQNDGQWNL